MKLWDSHLVRCEKEKTEKKETEVRDLTFLDVFAGWAGLAHAFAALGYKSRAFDRQKIEAQDFCTPSGFARLIFFALRVKKDGALI